MSNVGFADSVVNVEKMLRFLLLLPVLKYKCCKQRPKSVFPIGAFPRSFLPAPMIDRYVHIVRWW